MSKCKSNIFSESAVATYVALAYWSLNKVILKAPITILYFLKDEQPPLVFFVPIEQESIQHGQQSFILLPDVSKTIPITYTYLFSR